MRRRGFKVVEMPATALKLLPCKPDVCQVCGVKHDAWQAHNQESLHYQYKFFLEHKRWPTWDDAIAHCPEDIKEQWRAALIKRGVKLEQPKEAKS